MKKKHIFIIIAAVILLFAPLASSEVRLWFMVHLNLYHPHEYKLIDELNDLAIHREKDGYIKRFALVLEAPAKTEIIIIGPINGNTASFDLIIKDIQKKQYLSENYTLIKPNTSMIFMGLVGNSNSNMELLKTVLACMKQNDDRVFYLRGGAENQEAWRKTPLGPELKVLDVESMETIKKLDHFFNTLPLALYLFGQNRAIPPLRISYLLGQFEEFSKIACRPLERPRGIIQSICLLEEFCSYVEGPLTAKIIGEDVGVNWGKMDGLQETDKAVWSLISSTDLSYKERHQYFYDAYAILTIEEPFQESTLTLYNSLREQGFEKAGTFKIST